MTPLERAARALYALDPETTDVFRRDCLRPKEPPTHTTRDTLWEELDEATQRKHLTAARAVFEAIREPSEAMMSASIAASQHDFAITRAGMKRAYEVMINAALSEQGKP